MESEAGMHRFRYVSGMDRMVQSSHLDVLGPRANMEYCNAFMDIPCKTELAGDTLFLSLRTASQTIPFLDTHRCTLPVKQRIPAAKAQLRPSSISTMKPTVLTRCMPFILRAEAVLQSLPHVVYGLLGHWYCIGRPPGTTPPRLPVI